MEIPPLPDTTILLVEVGSTAHGTGIPGGEDHDELAVVVEPPAQVVGLAPHGMATVMQRTQPEGVRSGPGDVDRTLHSLRRFCRLAASGNPSILMAVWAPVEASSPEGDELRSLGDAFVGRHVIPRYRGYMRSQAERLLGVRGSGGREHLVARHGYDTKYAMHCARLGFQCLELLATGGLAFPVAGPEADWLRSVRTGEVAFAEWWDRVLALDAELARRADDPSVRPEPDRDRIDRWLVEVHRRVWTDGVGALHPGPFAPPHVLAELAAG